MRKKGELCTAAIHAAYQARYGGSVSRAQFTAVLQACNVAVAQLLLAGKVIKLPYKLGSFFVQKRKMGYQKLPFDYGHWQKTGQKRYHLNRHSDAFIARYHWQKQLVLFPGRNLYAFTPTRGNARALSQRMQLSGGHKLYQQYTPAFNKQKKAHAPLN